MGRRPFWIAAAVLAAGAAALLAVTLTRGEAAPASTVVPVADTPSATWGAGEKRAPDFRLRDQHGRPVSIAGFRGRPVIVTFLDPLCRSYCPLEARRLNRVLRTFPAASRPMVVAVSVNVRGNARRNLLEDIRKWQLVPEWRWAVGQESELAPVWKAYNIGVLVSSKRVAGITVYDVAHTEAAYVVDAQGYTRALFMWPWSADGFASTLRALSAAA